VSAVGTSSGGWIRVLDTQIMFPNFELPNSLNGNEKQKGENAVYTPVYTCESERQYVVNSWGY